MEKTVVLHSIHVWLLQTQTWLYAGIRGLPDEIESHIVCEKKENTGQFEIPNIHSLSDEPFMRSKLHDVLGVPTTARYERLIKRLAARHGASVLHSHFGNVAWANLGAALEAGMGHVVTFYGVDINYPAKNDPVWKERYAELFRRIDMVLCEGPHMARSVVGIGCPEGKVRINHLGVALDDIPFRPRSWTPGSPLKVLIAASFREKKGIPYALDALGGLKDELDLMITIIGDANDEPRSMEEKRKILSAIERNNLGRLTRMLGYQPYTALLREAYEHHVFLSPSLTAVDGDMEGGMPVTIIELLASGMPVVSTKNCDIPEVVEDGVSGLLAEERDAEGLAVRIKWLTEHPERWAEMALAGRRHAEEEFDNSIQGKRLAMLYEELISARR